MNRGTILKTKPGDTTRPTLGRIRENLFNIIRSKVPKAKVLDLFAGSGAVGLECLSRGSVSVVFVEKDPEAFRILLENIHKTGHETRSIAKRTSFESYLRSSDEAFDIIYADPPYPLKAYGTILEEVGRRKLLAQDGVLVMESERSASVPMETMEFICYRDVTYGNTTLRFYNNKQEV